MSNESDSDEIPVNIISENETEDSSLTESESSEFDIEELKDWGFKEIELGLNIDKIDVEEEPKNDNYIITITEDDVSKASKLFKELDKRGFNAKIKL